MLGERQEPWWQQTTARKKQSATLKDIPEAARARHWKYGRCGKGRGGREVAELDFDAGNYVSRYAGTETGDSQVGE